METPIMPGPNNPSSRTKNIILACVIFDIILIAGLGYYFFLSPTPFLTPTAPTTQEADTRVADLEEKVTELEKKLAVATMQQPEEEGPPTLEEKKPVVPEPTATDTPSANLFDATTAKYGDEIAGLTISQVGPFNPEYSDQAADNIVVIFTGETTVSGTWEHYGTDYMIGPITCMYADETSAAKLPKVIGDERTPWFCFNDEDGEKLGPEGTKGTATVIIKDYRYLSYPSEGSNSAKLVKIISKD